MFPRIHPSQPIAGRHGADPFPSLTLGWTSLAAFRWSFPSTRRGPAGRGDEAIAHKIRRILGGLTEIVVSSIVLILLGLVFFIVTAWIVTFGVETVLGRPPSADFVALSAALLSMGSLAGSSYSMNGFSGDDQEEDQYGTSEVA